MMRSMDNIGITFVNTLIGRGILNGIVNLSFAAFNFTPDDQGAVSADPAVACRLRMDKVCAVQLRDALNDLITIIEKAESSPQSETAEGLMLKSSKSVETTH